MPDSQGSSSEAEAVQAAILLHDIGHGPFSHVLEDTIVKGVSHEEISLMLMERMNKEMKKRGVKLGVCSNKPHEEDRSLLLQKFESMYQLGVRGFAVFFDDISILET